MANRTDVVDQSIAGAPLSLGIRISRFGHRYARFIFPAPALLMVACIIVYPVLYTGWMSLTEWFASSLTAPEFIGLQNFKRAFTQDERFRNAIWLTLYFTALATAAA